ncbi:MAG: polyphosphate polymerase domain-containing protein [Lachnospiraceae bacterium]|nr:polyphosphate polymerase domain-containing protein [Lachnospiraceae bacterium]
MFEELSQYRHEYKYIENDVNMISIRSRMRALMKRDSHTDERGYYSIRSLYFDDYNDRFLRENIDGVDERMKWRIRIYDRKSDFISLERKVRKSGLISKQSCAISLDDYYSVMAGRAEISSSNPPLFNLFIKDMRTSAVSPAMIVEYEREPFICSQGNTRVTFDRNIRSSSEVDALLSDRPLSSRPVMLAGQHLMEVKYDAFLPDYIAHAIEHGRMRQMTFSKYYLARKFPYNGLAKR